MLEHDYLVKQGLTVLLTVVLIRVGEHIQKVIQIHRLWVKWFNQNIALKRNSWGWNRHFKHCGDLFQDRRGNKRWYRTEVDMDWFIQVIMGYGDGDNRKVEVPIILERNIIN